MEKEEVSIEVLNSQGQLVKSIQRNYAAGIINEKIAIENFVVGIYEVQIRLDDKNISQKIIVR